METIGIWRQNISAGTSVLGQTAIKCSEKYRASQWCQKDEHSTWEGAPQLLEHYFGSALNLWQAD